MPTRRLIATAVLATLPLTAVSQPSAQQATSLMEEIVVTARKREQSLQDVSVSVMALPENLLKDAFLTSSEDLTQLVPSLNIQKTGRPRGSSFNIRGIGTQSFSSGAEPSVSTLLDGVVLGRSGMAFLQLLDVARVEVLRGPQGTLFGKNSTAGVVHIISQKPSEEFTGSVSATVIEDDEYRAGFTFSGPITDTLGYRLSGSIGSDEGFIEDVKTGDSLNERDEWNLRGKLRWDVTDDLMLEWTSDISDLEGDCCASSYVSLEPWPGEAPNNQAQVDGLLETLSPVVPGKDNLKVNTDFPTRLDVEGQGHSLTADWVLGEHTLTSITAYRDWSQFASDDADGLPTHPLNLWQTGATDQEQFTQELRLTSPADQTVSYVAGLFFFDQHIERVFERFILNGTGVSDFEVDTLNYAAFGEATWNINEQVRLILGARYTEDEIDFQFERASTSAVQAAVPYFEKSVKESDLSGKLALEWDATSDVLLYASYVEGYKGPAFNVVAGSNEDNTNPVDPETSESFELGMKSNWFDGKLVVNVSLFHTEYSDFQAQATESVLIVDENGNTQDADGNGVPDRRFSFLLTNVGEVTTEGVEIDFMAQPTENLSLFGGLAVIDAKIDSYEGGPCGFGQEFRGVGFRGQLSCGDDPAQQDLSGGELPYSPDWKFNIAANYVVPLDSQPVDIVLKANFRMQDDVQLSIDQDENQQQEAYEILDASIQLRDKDDRYSASLFVKNVFDEYYVSNISAQNENLVPNAYQHFLPRTFERRIGVEFRYNWN